MKTLMISGSSRPNSSNAQLLDALSKLFPNEVMNRYSSLDRLPVFSTKLDQHPWPEEVIRWRQALQEADALIICTPEYLHNLPALIKNALEWVTTSGELHQKRVAAITFTPNPPRGEKAMQSLRWSLQALEARVVLELDLYQKEVSFNDDGFISDKETITILKDMMEFLNGG